MKVMAILFRVVFSFIIVLALACYLQVSPTISLSEFCTSIVPGQLLGTLQGINAVTISLAIILLLGIFPMTRILEAAWNVLFCASMLVLLACGTYGLLGPGIALPNAIFNSEAVRQLCDSALTYQVPLALATLIFAAGWVCASACGRVALTTIISYALWYGVSELFFYTVQLWSSSANPAAPEALSMILSTPWVIAAVPGAFFLVYALLMALFETFITHAPRKQAAEATATEAQPEPAAEPEKPVDEPKAVQEAEKPVEEPVEPRQKTMQLVVPKPEAPASAAAAAEEEPEAPAAPQEPTEAPAEETTEPASPAVEEPQPAPAPAESEETTPTAEK